MKAADSLDLVCHALSDSTRRLILESLRARDEQTLFEICVRLTDRYKLTLSRQAISKHLRVLEDADLVRTSWKGRTKIHSMNSAPLRTLRNGWLAKFVPPEEKTT